jgi:hypothetical protein
MCVCMGVCMCVCVYVCVCVCMCVYVCVCVCMCVGVGVFMCACLRMCVQTFYIVSHCQESILSILQLFIKFFTKYQTQRKARYGQFSLL